MARPSRTEAFRLEQELVQPLEIFLHHDMVGDNPRCVERFDFSFNALSFSAAVRTLRRSPAQLIVSPCPKQLTEVPLSSSLVPWERRHRTAGSPPPLLRPHEDPIC